MKRRTTQPTSPDSSRENLFRSSASSSDASHIQEEQMRVFSTADELAVEAELNQAMKDLNELQEISTSVVANLEDSADELEDKTFNAAATAENTNLNLKKVWFPSSASKTALSSLKASISANIGSKNVAELAANLRELTQITDRQLKLVISLYKKLAEIREANQSRTENDLREEIEAMRADLDVAISRVDEFRGKFEIANRQVISLNAQVREARAETAEVKLDLQREKQARGRAEAELNALKRQLAEIQQAHQNSEFGKNTEHQARTRAEEERDFVRRGLQTAHQQIAGLIDERDVAQRNLQAAHQQIAGLTDDRDVALRDLRAAHQQIAGLTDNRDVALRDLRAAHQQIVGLTDERDVAQGNLQVAQLQIGDLTEQLTQAQDDAATQRRRQMAREAAQAAVTRGNQTIARQALVRQEQNRQFNQLYDVVVSADTAANVEINTFGATVRTIATTGHTNADEEKRRAAEFLRLRGEAIKVANDLSQAMQNLGEFIDAPAAVNVLDAVDINRARGLIVESTHVRDEALRTAALAEEHKNRHEKRSNRFS